MNISIARRLQLMMLLSMTGLIVLAISGAVVASRLRGTSQYLYANTLPSLEAITSINENFMKLRILTLYFIANPDPAKRTDIETKIREQQEKIRQGLERYKSDYLSGSRDRELLETEKNYFETYFTETGAILQKVKGGGAGRDLVRSGQGHREHGQAVRRDRGPQEVQPGPCQ